MTAERACTFVAFIKTWGEFYFVKRLGGSFRETSREIDVAATTKFFVYLFS